MKTVLFAAAFALLAAAPGRGAYLWGVLAPDNGGFTVQIPGEPQHTAENKADILYESWITKPDNLVMTMISLTDYFNPLDAKSDLKLDEKNFLAAVKGKVRVSKAGVFHGPNGEDLPSSVFTFVTESGWSGKSRIIVEGGTVFQTVVMWRRMLEGAAVLRRFEGSFKLLPRTKPPKPTPEPLKTENSPSSPPPSLPSPAESTR